jgi:hypothetical protein
MIPTTQGKYRADEAEGGLLLRVTAAPLDLLGHLPGLQAGLAARAKLCARVLVVQELRDRRVVARLTKITVKTASHHLLQ